MGTDDKVRKPRLEVGREPDAESASFHPRGMNNNIVYLEAGNQQSPAVGSTDNLGLNQELLRDNTHLAKPELYMLIAPVSH